MILVMVQLHLMVTTSHVKHGIVMMEIVQMSVVLAKVQVLDSHVGTTQLFVLKKIVHYNVLQVMLTMMVA